MRATVKALIGALAVGAALTCGVRGRAGAFAFRATIGAGPGEPGVLSIRVQSRSGGKPVASGLYQFLESGPSNQFNGRHGFTGLVYAYLTSGAELQYFCRAL
jgi:hypothetical protein